MQDDPMIRLKKVDCMAIAALPVDQRVIDIDSRRFASVEKALVELITNCDDSYARLEKRGAQVTGHIRITYERHQTGAVLVVADQAEGMSFERVCSILAYGGAHSPLARGEGDGRGYFGRGLKQAIYGLVTAGLRPFMPDDFPVLNYSGVNMATIYMTMGAATGRRRRWITAV